MAKGEIGLASMDTRYPELCLTQFADSAGYSRLRVKLQVLNPAEVTSWSFQVILNYKVIVVRNT